MEREGFDDALGAFYQLIEKHGQGAAGEVWRAVDRRTGESVAAKILRSEHVGDPDLVGRFLRERSILTGLRHPNVVSVRDLVAEGDRIAIIMDFVDAGSLRGALRSGGPLPPTIALGVAAAALDGLTAAHDQGVLHRDVKPDNVLLARDWHLLRPGDVKLTDFGIARILADRAGTTTGLLGSPGYMAPELLVTGACDLPADIYAMGITLYELLAGRTPFSGAGTDYTVAHRHVSSMPPRLPVPDSLWDAIASMLDKDPTRRPTAREAASMLRGLRPQVADLAPLPAQAPPEGFTPARGPATLLRGMEAPSGSEGGAEADPGTMHSFSTPDLGRPGEVTLHRPLPTVPLVEPRTRPATDSGGRSRARGWRDPRIIGVVLAAVVLIVVAVGWVSRDPGDSSATPATGTGPVRAQQQDQPLPTGLSTSRTASWDPRSRSVELTVTYTAQDAPLSGPFLEVVPGVHEDACPPLAWQSEIAQPNLPSVTGISTPCAWSVEPPPVPAQESTSVSATFPLELPAEDPDTALQEWLDGAAATTSAATTDPEITSTSYPVQRLTGIQVVVPPRTVSQKTLRLTLLPVWPSGPDQLNPLYRSPSVGAPSSTLVAVAGGEAGVRFSDGCSGALSVSRDGLVVTALSVAPECRVNVRVGDFNDLVSESFEIVTRGG